MRHSRFLLLVVIVIFAAGCSTSGVVGTSQLAAIVSRFLDVTGDATATSGTIYDVVGVSTHRIDNSPFGSYDALRTEITLAQPPVLPPNGFNPSLGTEFVFRVYFDTDQDPATGGWDNVMCGTLGVNYLVDGSNAADGGNARLANGNYTVRDSLGATSGEATVVVSGNTLTVTTPLSAIGGDDGATNLSVRIGNGADSTTDCTPKGGGAIITREGIKDKR